MQLKVEHLRVLRCDVYSHIPKDERSKFDSKAKKYILLGYESQTKGYRLFDQSKRKVFHSRDVTFNDNKKENEVVSNNEPGHHLVVEFSSDLDSESHTPVESVPQQVLRRSTRERQEPKYFRREQTHFTE